MLETYLCDDICMIIYKKLLPVEKYNEVMVDLIRESSMQELISGFDDYLLHRVIRPSFIKISDEILSGYADSFADSVCNTHSVYHYTRVQYYE